MKKSMVVILGLFLCPLILPAQSQEIDLGRVYFPKAFTHAGQVFAGGSYRVSLARTEGTMWFKVFDNQKQHLFDELALSVAAPERKTTRLRIRKEFLKGYEFFRIRVTTPEGIYNAYFLIQPEIKPESLKPPTPEENSPEEAGAQPWPGGSSISSSPAAVSPVS